MFGPSPTVFSYAHTLPVYGRERLCLLPFLSPGASELQDTPTTRAREYSRALLAIQSALAFIDLSLDANPQKALSALLKTLPALLGRDSVLQAHDLLQAFLASHEGIASRRLSSPTSPDPAFALAWVQYALEDLYGAWRGDALDVPLHACYLSAQSSARACSNAGASLPDHLHLLTQMQALAVTLPSPDFDLFLL